MAFAFNFHCEWVLRLDLKGHKADDDMMELQHNKKNRERGAAGESSEIKNQSFRNTSCFSSTTDMNKLQ